MVGAQWGDEGKGKIVDLLAQDSDVVCRYQGGPNAGHTIVVGGETWKLRQMPSGVVSGTQSVIGAGCVVDAQVFVDEVDLLAERGIDPSIVRALRQRAPDHALARDDRPGVRTPPRLVADRHDPAWDRADVRRQGVPDRDPRAGRARPEDPAREDRGRARREEPLARADLRGRSRSTSRRSWSQYAGFAERLAPFVGDASLLVDDALRAGKRVLFEGAQATMLDLDHGTYPFVTSSNPIASGAATGIGIGPTRIDRVLGISKAYVTRVGEGPFPSEIAGADQERLRELGGEYGTVTGRERRCGWLDLVALRYAVRVNGMTSLALTKLDVLSAFDELPVCVRYRLRDGSETEHFPAHQSDFHHATAVWETLPGWSQPLDDAASLDDLPAAARAYVEFVARDLQVPIELVGVGAARERVLA